MNKLNLLPAQVRAIGEHYVLARLIERGFIAGLAPENTKSVDLIIMSEDGRKTFQIQVKTRRKGRASDEGWHMQQKHESIVNENLFYIFVTLPMSWNDNHQPETFVIPSGIVASILSKTHKDWFDAPGARGQKRNITKMRRVKPIYKDSPTISPNWMDEFRDKWEILK
jgi:hypothetical protein